MKVGQKRDSADLSRVFKFYNMEFDPMKKLFFQIDTLSKGYILTRKGI